MDETLRVVLVAQYVNRGYTPERAEVVVDLAMGMHTSCIAHRDGLLQAGSSALQQEERSACLNILLHLELWYAQHMLGVIQPYPPETLQ